MAAQDEINKLKETHKPKEGYSLLVGIASGERVVGAVFKKVEVRSRRYGKEEVECSVFNQTVTTYGEFVKVFKDYLDRRDTTKLLETNEKK